MQVGGHLKNAANTQMIGEEGGGRMERGLGGRRGSQWVRIDVTTLVFDTSFTLMLPHCHKEELKLFTTNDSRSGSGANTIEDAYAIKSRFPSNAVCESSNSSSAVTSMAVAVFSL